MRTIDVGLRLGDAIDQFHLANGFESVIGYECQERSNHPFSHSYDAYRCYKVSDFKVCTMQAGKGSHVIIYMARKAIQGDDWQDSDGGEEAQNKCV